MRSHASDEPQELRECGCQRVSDCNTTRGCRDAPFVPSVLSVLPITIGVEMLLRKSGLKQEDSSVLHEWRLATLDLGFAT